MVIGRTYKRLAGCLGVGAVLLLALSTAYPARPKHPYDLALERFWGELYAQGGTTLYCNAEFSADSREKVNVEHVFPVSWIAHELGCGNREECRQSSPRFNKLISDLHNMWPANRDVNQARRSYAFGTVKGERHPFENCDFEVDVKLRMAEPRPKARGDIARSIFYMYQRYDLDVHRRHGERLRAWHAADEPDEHERARNHRIEKLQGNRNPFIDRPELVDQLRF